MRFVLVLLAVVRFGVRMARIGFMYVSIYLYAVAVGVACGAFSCSCGGVVVWLIDICKVYSLWCGVVWLYRVYICIYGYNALVWCGGVYMDRYI